VTDYLLRSASAADLPAIVALLADDPLGAARESTDDLAPYMAAFTRLQADPGHDVIVAERDGAVVGTLQLTIIPGLSRCGTTRALIEGVRIAAGQRGGGLGTLMIRHAIDEARRQGCGLVQLTSDATRTDAHRFYERLGFVASHVGFKLQL
jgi:GNAT superfamily N-acetyltransferase